MCRRFSKKTNERHFTSLHSVFPQIRPAGINLFQGLQLRVLLECGHYSRAGIIIRTNLDLDINPRNPDQNRDLRHKKQTISIKNAKNVGCSTIALIILIFFLVRYVLIFIIEPFFWFQNSRIFPRGDYLRAGIIKTFHLWVRVLLECGYYSREGLIWGNTVSVWCFDDIFVIE